MSAATLINVDDDPEPSVFNVGAPCSERRMNAVMGYCMAVETSRAATQQLDAATLAPAYERSRRLATTEMKAALDVTPESPETYVSRALSSGKNVELLIKSGTMPTDIMSLVGSLSLRAVSGAASALIFVHDNVRKRNSPVWGDVFVAISNDAADKHGIYHVNKGEFYPLADADGAMMAFFNGRYSAEGARAFTAFHVTEPAAPAAAPVEEAEDPTPMDVEEPEKKTVVKKKKTKRVATETAPPKEKEEDPVVAAEEDKTVAASTTTTTKKSTSSTSKPRVARKRPKPAEVVEAEVPAAVVEAPAAEEGKSSDGDAIKKSKTSTN